MAEVHCGLGPAAYAAGYNSSADTLALLNKHHRCAGMIVRAPTGSIRAPAA
jgi:hypothetical protein